LILHGAGSQKENHFGIAREMAGAGLAAICFDQRGHGESDGPMDGRIVSDAVAIAGLLDGLPVGIRGSSMGGWVALAAAEESNAKALVAICPTTAAQLTLGAESGRFPFDADLPSLVGKLAEGEVRDSGRDILLAYQLEVGVVGLDTEVAESNSRLRRLSMDRLAVGVEFSEVPEALFGRTGCPLVAGLHDLHV
jgi:pimeloyl-ACP methyl ester carboxylesterase